MREHHIHTNALFALIRTDCTGADFGADCADDARGGGWGRCYGILVFTEFHGILQNSAEFACMKRFFI